MWEDFRENVIVTFAFDSKQMEKVFIVSWVLNNWVTCVTWVLNNLILIKSQQPKISNRDLELCQAKVCEEADRRRHVDVCIEMVMAE